MPRSAAHWAAALLKFAISHTAFPAAVVAEPHGAVRRDRDAEAWIALLAAKMRALRTGDLPVALPVVSKVYAVSFEFMANVHQ